jgi:ATP-dependent DNA ligase
MALRVRPPVEPMLARLERELPRGDYLYEPKWDGFRCLVFRDGGDVDLRSRNDRPLARYFPEIVEAVLALAEPHLAVDGELVALRGGTLDFASLLARIHPAASRVERLRRELPASYVAFDLLAVGADDVRDRAFAERRRLLLDVLRDAREPIHVTPLTDDLEVAADWLRRFQGSGVDGVVAKHRELRYEAGARRMVKIKTEHTIECVAAGFRWHAQRPVVASLLLGLYDESGELHHVGVASSLREEQRLEFAAELLPLAVHLEAHPWAEGYLLGGGTTGRLPGSAGRWAVGMELDWVPLAPERVCEVAYDQLDERRFRHPARFVRWRPDREPLSCMLDQLYTPVPDVAGLLA